MNRVTKAEARAQRREHAKAVSEGRVLCVNDLSFQVFPTTEARDAAAAELVEQGHFVRKVPAVPSPYLDN